MQREIWTFYFQEDYSPSCPFFKYGSSPTSQKSASSPNASFNKSLNVSTNGNVTSEDLIQNEKELQSYLEEARQKKHVLSTDIDQPSNLLSSFWSHPAIRNPGEVSPLLRRCTYQLAPIIGKFVPLKFPIFLFHSNWWRFEASGSPPSRQVKDSQPWYRGGNVT